MKHILWMMLTGLCCLTAFAQKNYSLKGKVIDVEGRAIEFANVALFRTDSTMVSGVTTGGDGRFVLQAPAGDGYLRISYVGYIELFLPLKNLSNGLDLGNLTLTSESIGLDEVTVEAAHVTRKIDRQIIFPTHEQLEKSLNGLELTQRLGLPRIFVNSNNHSISMAGNES
ncbi:MAG: carboxypeptidase-like regulatory domain-containing protein, partial [Parabacteroides sp.]|nr:carboxypeptidase-like regulatory domain-containing protein [Parabacteroides sp.]